MLTVTVTITAITLVASHARDRTPGGNGTASAPAPSAAPTIAPGDKQILIPDLVGVTGQQARIALDAAGALDVEFVGGAMTDLVAGQTPAAGVRQRAGAPVRIVLAPPEPHREISARDWLVIAKNPDAHIGERIVIFGVVTQFDAATGTDSFRASVDAVRHDQSYEYETNTFLTGTADGLSDIVVEDVFRAEVTVGGSLTYDTQIGGSTTVPVLRVDSIARE